MTHGLSQMLAGVYETNFCFQVYFIEKLPNDRVIQPHTSLKPVMKNLTVVKPSFFYFNMKPLGITGGLTL